MSVKSVYNFVPAPKESEVFKPDWADQVSHDIPFSDGESGEIEIKITAETPIFIRNGHSKEDADTFKIVLKKQEKDKNYQPSALEQERIIRYLSFSNYNGEYFIPATSLKGMFRNVLEIITNSRMNRTENISEKNTVTYGMRDMNNPEYTADNAGVKSGWLIKDGEGWKIQSCVNHKIALRDIENKFNLEVSSLKNTTGKSKNELCKKYIENKILNFSFSKDLGKWVGNQYEFDNYGDFEGHIVLYGDIDNKRYDYIFSGPKGAQYAVDSKLVETLDNIEKNSENVEESLWLYFRKENWKPGIPVFFVPDKDGKTVKHFGLTKLYRRNNSHYLNKLEPFKGYLNSDEKDRMDLAELLFGSVRAEPLKGRVFISNAWSNNAKTGEQEERILNSPKPSFYPAYLIQKGTKGQLKGAYKTYHDEDAELRGFKRYPVHDNIKPNIESDNENIASQFIPIKDDTVFVGKIRYFNLRPCEVGALTSAITFHGNSDKFFHSIGGAKPYGFGKIKVEIKHFEKFAKYLSEFEFIMNQHSKNGAFISNKNIKELLSIGSNPKDNQIDSLLTYPLIEKEIEVKGKKMKINEFNLYKQDKDLNKNSKNREFLENYSERNGIYKIKSEVNDEFLNKVRQREEELKLEQEKIQKEKKEKEKKEYEMAISTKDVSKIKLFLTENPDTSYRAEAEALIDAIVSDEILAKKKRKEQEEAKRIAEKREREKEAAAQLVEDIELIFKNDKFKTAQDVLKPPFEQNKFFEYTDSQKDIITDQLKKCWEKDSKVFYRKKKLVQFPGFPWSDIINWLGEDRAKALYDELVNNG